MTGLCCQSLDLSPPVLVSNLWLSLDSSAHTGGSCTFWDSSTSPKQVIWLQIPAQPPGTHSAAKNLFEHTAQTKCHLNISCHHDYSTGLETPSPNSMRSIPSTAPVHPLASHSAYACPVGLSPLTTLQGQPKSSLTSDLFLYRVYLWKAKPIHHRGGHKASG